MNVILKIRIKKLVIYKKFYGLYNPKALAPVV